MSERVAGANVNGKTIVNVGSGQTCAVNDAVHNNNNNNIVKVNGFGGVVRRESGSDEEEAFEDAIEFLDLATDCQVVSDVQLEGSSKLLNSIQVKIFKSSLITVSYLHCFVYEPVF